jgi:hypothetical protein
MPIPISNYCLITSGVGGGNNVSTRSLGALVISGNPLIPTGAVVSFTSAAAVGTYFGTSSEEYLRAVFYFGWISKNISQANQISFWNWNNDAATGSLIYGAQETFNLSTFTSITTGDFTLTLGGYTDHLTGVNFSGDASLAAVAATLQAAIRAVSAGGAAWTGATVAYNATPTQGGLPQFTLTSGTTGTDVVSVTAGSITDMAGPLGWLTGAILSNGTAAQTITTNLNNLINLTNNFGSFCFTTALAPVLATIEAAANWNNSLTPNNQFMFLVSITAANASTWCAGLATIGGCAGVLVSPQAGAYSEMEPMMILAATDYTKRNSVQNYMYQEFNDTASVTTGALQATYDALLLNYYGNTQTAGQLLSFFQRGVMFGIATNPQDMGIYANEIWLKDAIGAAIMTLLLSLAEVPANTTGQAQLTTAVQAIINQAKFNGTISSGKTLTTTQQLYITQATGSATAWQQVQSIGYWFNVVITPYVVNGLTQYKAVYTLIYSKNDVIRFVSGTDVLI